MILNLYIRGIAISSIPVVVERKNINESWESMAKKREAVIKGIVGAWRIKYFEEMEKGYEIIAVAQSRANPVLHIRQEKRFDPTKKYQRVPSEMNEVNKKVDRTGFDNYSNKQYNQAS